MHSGSYVLLEGSEINFAGVVFHGGGDSHNRPMKINGDLNTIYDCVIEHQDSDYWVEVKGVGNTVRNCRFSEKTGHDYSGSSAGQQLLQSRVSATSHHNNILNNVFRDYTYEPGTDRGNGYETIQIRDGDDETNEGFNLVEGNYFQHCDCEAEIISIKTSHNVIRNNAFEDNMGALTFRSHDNNIAEGNVFVAHDRDNDEYGGIRIYGKNHVLDDNWFIGLTDGAVTLNHASDGHDTAKNITFSSNNFVNSYNAIRKTTYKTY